MRIRMNDLPELKALLRALPELIALADAGQITAAAAHLDVQQPTFSRTITRLSDALDVPVVRRSGRGVELTPEGRAMLPHARRALEEARRAIAAVHDRAADEDRTVAVAFQTALGQALVPELLRKLTTQHPALRFELRQGSRRHCLELLAEGWADVVLVSPAPPPGPEAETVVLRVEPLVLVVPAQHHFAERTRMPVRELADEPLIAMRPAYGLRTLVEGLFAAAGLEPSVVFESDDFETMRGLIAAGLGISILPPAARPAAGIVEIPLADPQAHREIAASWATTATPTTAASRLRELLRAEAATSAAPAAVRRRAAGGPNVTRRP